MKVEARRVAGFLEAPGGCRAVLLHGEDAGLIRHRADRLTVAAGGSLDDPFCVAVLERDGHGRLEEEALALSLTGGRRVVRVREVGEGVLAVLRRVLAAKGEALLVLEAPGLGRGKLRSFVEAAPEAAAIACHPEEGAALERTIRDLLHEQEVTLEPGAAEWLSGHLGSDRVALRGEIEKLALYAGPGGVATLEAAQACIGDTVSLQLEDALFAATAGDLAALDRTLERALAEGVNAIAVIRPALSHLQRLHQARLLVADGMAPEDAARSARPPVFFRRVPAFTRALSTWTPAQLQRAIDETRLVEQACKTTGARMDALCRRFLSVLARQAVQARRR